LPRGLGLQPVEAKSLGPVLPSDPTLPPDQRVSAPSGELMSTMPPANRTTPATRPDSDKPRPRRGVRFSEDAQRAWELSEQVVLGRTLFGLLPHPPKDRELAYHAWKITPVNDDYVISLHAGLTAFKVMGKDVSVEVLAEVIAADPRWKGPSQPI